MKYVYGPQGTAMPDNFEGVVVSDPDPNVTITASWNVNTGSGFALCPDLLDYEQIGEADTLRGDVVRLFFWLMQVWPVSKGLTGGSK